MLIDHAGGGAHLKQVCVEGDGVLIGGESFKVFEVTLMLGENGLAVFQKTDCRFKLTAKCEQVTCRFKPVWQR